MRALSKVVVGSALALAGFVSFLAIIIVLSPSGAFPNDSAIIGLVGDDNDKSLQGEATLPHAAKNVFIPKVAPYGDVSVVFIKCLGGRFWNENPDELGGCALVEKATIKSAWLAVVLRLRAQDVVGYRRANYIVNQDSEAVPAVFYGNDDVVWKVTWSNDASVVDVNEWLFQPQLHFDRAGCMISRLGGRHSGSGSIDYSSYKAGQSEKSYPQLQPCDMGAFYCRFCGAPLLAKLVVFLVALLASLFLVIRGSIAGRENLFMIGMFGALTIPVVGFLLIAC